MRKRKRREKETTDCADFRRDDGGIYEDHFLRVGRVSPKPPIRIVRQSQPSLVGDDCLLCLI